MSSQVLRTMCLQISFILFNLFINNTVYSNIVLFTEIPNILKIIDLHTNTENFQNDLVGTLQ